MMGLIMVLISFQGKAIIMGSTLLLGGLKMLSHLMVAVLPLLWAENTWVHPLCN